MSATGRNKADKPRDPFDWYRTPPWCVHRLLEADPWIRNVETLLAPCAGDGAILEALGVDKSWTGRACAWEIQERFEPALRSLLLSADVAIGDALKLAQKFSSYRADMYKSGLLKTPVRFRLALENPPFGIAFPLLKALWPLCQDIIFLLRVSFLGSDERQPFLSANPPSLRIIPNRPQFKWGEADNCEYAWMRWQPHPVIPITRLARNGEVLDLDPEEYHSNPNFVPDVRILGATPLEVRQLERGPKPHDWKPRAKKEART